MSTQPVARSRLQFGPFEFDPPTGELRKHRTLIRLQGQPLRILEILLDRPGQIISRLELQRKIWPDATSGDFDHGLNAAINKLRQSLNDSADQPRYIQTVPGKGYRFIAPLQAPGPRASLEVIPSVDLDRPSRSTSTMALLALLGIGVLLAIVWLLRAPNPAPEMTPLQFTISPPPGYWLEPAGPRQSIALSPDGRFLAFSAMDVAGRYQVFLREFSKRDPVLLPDGLNARSVFWAMDGESLYYTSGGKLRRYGLASKSSVVVADAMTALSNGIPLPGGNMLLSNSIRSLLLRSGTQDMQPFPRHHAWPEALPDSPYFLSYDSQPGTFRRKGKLIPLNGQGPEIPVGDFHSRIAYTGSLRSPSAGYLISLEEGAILAQPFDLSRKVTTGPPVALVQGVPGFASTGSADFSVSSAGVLAYSPLLEQSQFFWVDRTGNRLKPATPANLSSKYAAVSPDGRNIVSVNFDVKSGTTRLWLYSTESGSQRELAMPFGSRNGPIWSPDSRSLVYMRSTTNIPKLAMRSIDPSAGESYLPEADFMIPTSWSSDGRYILYNNTGMPLTDQEGQSDIFLVDLEDKGKIRPFIQTPFQESSAAFSPAMDYVAFVASDSGKPELYLQALSHSPELHPSGERISIAQTAAGCLRWRADGKELYYLGAASQVFAVSLQFSPQLRVSRPVPLFRIQPEARAVVHGLLSFDVSPDGKRFLIPTVSSTESHSIVVVRNWEQALLPQR